jgi:hypothetical protein
MKIINNKKIFSLTLAFFLLPFFSNAQTFSEHIQDIDWNVNPGIFSATGGGVITTDVPYPSFRWQIEIGFAGNVTTNQDGSLNVSGPGIQYVPSNTNNLFTSGLAHLTPISSNEFSFNLPVNFQNTLWPATRYYFDIVEWHQLQGTSNPVRDYEIFETQPVQDLNLNVNEVLNGDVELTLQVPSSANTYNPTGGAAIQGMPIDFYILSDDRSGQLINPQNEGLVVFAGTGVFNSAGAMTINIPIGTNLDQNSFYWVKLINGQPDAGGLLLLNEDIPFLLSDLQEEEESGGGSGSNPDFPEVGAEFESGLITCDGVTVPCTFEKLLLMVNKVLRFLIFVIGVPIITLSFAYAGFLMVTSGGNPSKKDEAKSIIGNAVVGLIILLAAWLIVRTVLVIFGYTGPLLGILGA